MATTYISLRISGSMRRQGGFVPIVIAGAVFPLSPQEESVVMDRPLAMNEKQALAFRHREKYILYQLIDTQVRSFDAATDGRLSIAVAIPSDKQLAGGKSPYTLLREVHQLFCSKYMTEQPDGTHVFRNVDADSDIFRQILDLYPTEPRTLTRYVPMAQQGLTGTVHVDPDKLEAFFADTQYSEFKPFSEILVATQPGATISPGLEDLTIPRPSALFSVWENGKDTGKTLQDLNEQHTTSVSSIPDHHCHNVTFTLQQLINAGGNGITDEHGSSIKIDAASSRIVCSIKQTQIFYDVVMQWDVHNGNDMEWLKQQIELGKVRISFAGKALMPSTPTQVQPSLIRSNVAISPTTISDYKLSASSKIDSDNKRVVVTVKMEKKPGAQPYFGNGKNSGKGSSPANGITTPKPSHGPTPFNKQTKNLFIIGALAFVMLVAGLSYIILKDDPDPKPDPKPDPFTAITSPSEEESSSSESGSVSEESEDDDDQKDITDIDSEAARLKEQAAKEQAAKKQAAKKANDEDIRKQKRDEALGILKRQINGKNKKADLDYVLNNYRQYLTEPEKKQLKNVIIAFDKMSFYEKRKGVILNSYTWKQLENASNIINNSKIDD